MHTLRRAARGAAIVASLACLQRHTAGCETNPTELTALTERRTGQRFALHRRTVPAPASDEEELMAAGSGASHQQHCLGVSVRCMLGWCAFPPARGYAFGLYANDDAIAWGNLAAREAAAAGVTADAQAGRSFQDLLARKAQLASGVVMEEGEAHLQSHKALHNAEVMLVLSMARDIAGEHLAHGFQNSLLWRLKNKQMGSSNGAAAGGASAGAPLLSGKAAAGTSGGGGGVPIDAASAAALAVPSVPLLSNTDASNELAQVTRFAAAFNGRKFVVGDEITFVWCADGVMRSYFRGAHVPEADLTAPGIIAALFQVYTGEGAVSSSGVATFNANWSKLIASPDAVAWVPPPPTPTPTPTPIMVGGRELPSPVVTGRLNQVVGDDGDVSIPLASRVRLSWNEFVDRHQLPLKRVLVPKHDEEVLAAAHKQHVHASASASGSAHVAARALRPQVNARFLEEVVLTEQAGK